MDLKIERKNTTWHPCSQMKDHESFKPLEISRAQGSYLELTDGNKIIDTISSWWCKPLGHAHPRLKQAILAQMDKFEHVIMANTTNSTIEKLSNKLASLSDNMSRVFYASDGACAVEIAMKMSIHYRKINGQTNKNKFISLKNSYHGETIGALSVSDLGIYKEPYQEIIQDNYFIDDLPYVSNKEDIIWNDSSNSWQKTQKQLEQLKDKVTAIIFEPIVQGANGMKIYSKDFLYRLANWAKNNDIHLIADEIMTGLGRTGKTLACEHANIKPDFLCLGKALTGGWMALSSVVTTEEVFQTFYDDFKKGKSFLHSHTYSGNALAAAVALEALNTMEEENLYNNNMEDSLLKNMRYVQEKTGKIKNIRAIGAIAAADLVGDSKEERLGFKLYQKAIEQGLLLRPIGNSIYWAPPLNISEADLEKITLGTIEAINSL